MNNRTIYLTFITFAAVLMGVGLWGIITHAEFAAATLTIPDRVDGSLDASTPDMIYEIPVNEGQVFSVLVMISAGDLKLDLTLIDPAGNVVAEDTPAAAGASVYAIEGVTPTEQGVYQLIVTRVGNTSGDYSVAITPVDSEMTLHVP